MKTLYFLSKDIQVSKDSPLRTMPNSLLMSVNMDEMKKTLMTLEDKSEENAKKVMTEKFGADENDIISASKDCDSVVIIATEFIPKEGTNLDRLFASFNTILFGNTINIDLAKTPYSDKSDDFKKALRTKLIRLTDSLYSYSCENEKEAYDFIKSGYSFSKAEDPTTCLGNIFTSLGIPLVGTGWSQGTAAFQATGKQES